MLGRLLCVLLVAAGTTISTKCGDIKIPEPPKPSPVVSASPISSPSPLPSVTPEPTPEPTATPAPPEPSVSPSTAPTPVPSVVPSASPSPGGSPVACEQPTREPRPSLGRNGNVLANRLTPCGHEGCTCGDSPAWFYEYGLVPHDAGSIAELRKQMLPDGSGGYVVVSNGAHAGWPMDYWGRLYSTFPPRPDSMAHSPEDGYSNICPPPPCPSPSVTPPPQPSPRPSVSPIPEPSTDPGAKCAANGLKLGLRAVVDKRNDCKDCKGFRNSFEVTPTRDGVPQGPETGCGEAFIEKYGEIVGKIIESGGRESGFEHQGCSLEDWNKTDGKGCHEGDFYLFVDATNSDGDPDHWSGKTYLAGGPRTYCVTWPHLTTWRCQDGAIDDRGAAVGFGPNAQAYDVPKSRVR